MTNSVHRQHAMTELARYSSTGRSKRVARSVSKHGRLGAYSRVIDRGVIGDHIDGRSREGRFLRSYEAMLREHVGGKPSVVKRQLIQRAARVALHLELLDEKSFAGGHALTMHDARFYIAWSNSLARLLSRLGMDAATEKAPSLIRALADAT